MNDPNEHHIAQAAIARDRCERAVHLLGGIIEDWAGEPPQQFDNAERLKTVLRTLQDAAVRCAALLGEAQS